MDDLADLAAAAVAAYRSNDHGALADAMSAIEVCLDDAADRASELWESDPRRFSSDPRDRATWVLSDPDGRRSFIGEPAGDVQFASDGWCALSWVGAPVSMLEPERVLTEKQWRSVIHPRGHVGNTAPVEKVTLHGHLRCYRVGPAIFDARRVEEWVLMVGDVAECPASRTSPAIWRTPQWTATVMPLNESAGDATEGWPSDLEAA